MVLSDDLADTTTLTNTPDDDDDDETIAAESAGLRRATPEELAHLEAAHRRYVAWRAEQIRLGRWPLPPPQS